MKLPKAGFGLTISPTSLETRAHLATHLEERWLRKSRCSKAVVVVVLPFVLEHLRFGGDVPWGAGDCYLSMTRENGY